MLDHLALLDAENIHDRGAAIVRIALHVRVYDDDVAVDVHMLEVVAILRVLREVGGEEIDRRLRTVGDERVVLAIGRG